MECNLKLIQIQETKQLTLEEIDLLFGDRDADILPGGLDDKQKQIHLEQISQVKKQLAKTTATAVH